LDEGAVRIDTVKLHAPLDSDAPSSLTQPSIIATEPSKVNASNYRAVVIDSYDREADTFIESTRHEGKYPELEESRSRFANLVRGRFGAGADVRILDVGAGAGRDTTFFLNQRFTVTAIEGAPSLVTFLRSASVISQGLEVLQVNLLDRSDLTNALGSNQYHGVWMCATLLHMPAAVDIESGNEGALMSDAEVLAALAKHLLPGGFLYVDNKLGVGAHLKERGNVLGQRWFRYRTQEELASLVTAASLTPVDSGWHNGTNGFDAWVWVTAGRHVRSGAGDVD